MMKVNLTTQHEMTPAAMAEALASATPEEFAEFWFQFADKVEDNKITEFAMAMAPGFGGKRKDAFKKLYTQIEFFELCEKSPSRLNFYLKSKQ